MSEQADYEQDLDILAVKRYSEESKSFLNEVNKLPKSVADYWELPFPERLGTAKELFELDVFEDFTYKSVLPRVKMKVSPGQTSEIDVNGSHNLLLFDIQVKVKGVKESPAGRIKKLFEFVYRKDDEGNQQVVARNHETGQPVEEGSDESELLDIYVEKMLIGPVEKRRDIHSQNLDILGHLLLKES